MHADGLIDLQAIGHAFDFQARFAEVEQQAETQTGGLEIIDALGTMRLVQRFDGLQLDEKQILDHQVRKVLANRTPPGTSP